jgi:hypothetical protein
MREEDCYAYERANSWISDKFGKEKIALGAGFTSNPRSQKFYR